MRLNNCWGTVYMERSEGTGFDQTTSIGDSVSDSGGGITGRIKSVGSSVKDKAAGLPAMIADGLEAGAKALKQRQPAAATGDASSVADQTASSIDALTDNLASAKQSSADWLRDAAIDQLNTRVEKQDNE